MSFAHHRSGQLALCSRLTGPLSSDFSLETCNHEQQSPMSDLSCVSSRLSCHQWIAGSVQHVSGTRVFWHRDASEKQVSKSSVCISERENDARYILHQQCLIRRFPQKLVRIRCAQKRDLHRRWRLREFGAAGGVTVSAGAAQLWATSTVSVTSYLSK